MTIGIKDKNSGSKNGAHHGTEAAALGRQEETRREGGDRGGGRLTSRQNVRHHHRRTDDRLRSDDSLHPRHTMAFRNLTKYRMPRFFLSSLFCEHLFSETGTAPSSTGTLHACALTHVAPVLRQLERDRIYLCDHTHSSILSFMHRYDFLCFFFLFVVCVLYFSL